jgi:DNA primase
LLLLIYLHCPDYRETIVSELDNKDLVFSIKYYRFLWQEINLVLENLTENNTHNNLLITVQENIVNHPDLAEKLTNIFHLSENDEQILFQPADCIQRQIALLQTIILEKYNQYCQQQMSQLNQEKDLIKMTYYYEEFKATEAKLYELNPQRIQ